LAGLRQRASELKQQLDQCCQVAGVNEFSQLTDVEQTSRRIRETRARLVDTEQRLLELSGGHLIDELARQVDGRGFDELSAHMVELDQEIAELDRQREEWAGRVRELETKCGSVNGSSAAAEADERALGILANMHADAERFLRLRLATVLLRQQIDRFRAENEDPLIARASDLFSRLTCHEFIGLRTDYAEDDRPVIVGVRRTGTPLAVDAMSDGTRDQLYLALRLAYLERRLSQHEPLPFIIDDVLINFDDDRSLATLEVLADLSRRTQVLFFTHHRHLVKIAEAHVADALFVHELECRELVVSR
jgi:uncharacterized protein YhaN